MSFQTLSFRTCQVPDGMIRVCLKDDFGCESVMTIRRYSDGGVKVTALKTIREPFPLMPIELNCKGPSVLIGVTRGAIAV